MQSLLQALNIGTMATWLSVSGASTVAVLVQNENRAPVTQNDSRLDASFGDVIDLDAASSQPAAGSAAPGEESAEPTEAAPAEPVPVEQVAALPELADVAPLPEIPDLPAAKTDELASESPKPQARPAMVRRATGTAAVSQAAGKPGATGVGNGSGNGSAAGPGSADSGAGAARLSRGRIPKPDYPEACRRANQEGRVVVTFTVDEAGNVVAAKVTGKCAFSALDQSALDAVYRGKFPPGPRASASKAIVFKLH
ncbi:MAG TPA: TonB family protein [Luteolibacter sp.]